jgi:broad specificity phosphatase PhoE
MSKLILIKHASPQVDPSMPPEQWHLSEQGKTSCIALAEAVRPHKPAMIVSSTEVKAIETAELLAASLGLPTETLEDLAEHDRSNVPHMRSGDFISMMELFFRKPTQLVLGRETADAALSRFRSAIDRVLASHPGQDIAVVSHGTVIALLLATLADKNGFPIWREMGLPSLAVMEIPSMKVLEMVARVG